jgi:C4-dicarboxylate-binding protein DctP
MKKVALAVIASLMAVTFAGCGGDSKETSSSSDKTYTLKFSHVVAPDSVKGKAAQKFADLTKEKTGGKVKVEIYPSSQLYGDKDELDALVAGNVQMIAPSVTKMVKLDPRFQFVDMPYLFENRDHVLKFFKSDLGKNLLASKAFINNDIKGLEFWENGFKEFTNNKRELKTAADFKGLKFRAQAGKVLESQFKSLGAGSATIAFGETYAALQQGTVDGQENTFNNMDTQKYQEVQKYMTLTDHGRIDYAIFVNNTFWEGLPAELRKGVEEALKESTDYELKLADEDNKTSFENLKKSGKFQITELSAQEKADLGKAMQPVYDEFKSAITPELIDGIKKLK